MPRQVNQAFPYVGSKATLFAEQLRHRLPDHHTFVDAYGGSGAALMARETPSPNEVFNDLDDVISNFYNQCVFAKDELLAMVQATPAICDRLVMRAFNLLLDGEGSELDRAWAWLYLVYATINKHHPLARRKPIIRQDRRTRKDRRRWLTADNRVNKVHERFKQVQIKCMPAVQLINDYDDEDTFFYVDPPYLPTVRECHSNGLYRKEMSYADHIELLECIAQVKGKVMVSGYASELYNVHLADWKTETFPARTHNHNPRTEKIWMNY